MAGANLAERGSSAFRTRSRLVFTDADLDWREQAKARFQTDEGWKSAFAISHQSTNQHSDRFQEGTGLVLKREHFTLSM